jgi:hypothetical protein
VNSVKHVLLIWELGGNRGHIDRLCCVAKVLKLRGCKVTFVVRAFDRVHAYLFERGWDCIAAPWTTTRVRGQFPALCHEDWLLAEGFENVQVVQRMLLEWQQLISKLSADFAFLDYSPSAAYALHTLQFPYLTLGTGFCTPAYENKATCFRPWDKQAWAEASTSHVRLQRVFDNLRIYLSSYSPESMANLYTSERVALMTFHQLDHFADRSIKGKYWGVLWSSQGQSIRWRSNEGKSRILCYLHAQFDELTPFLTMLRNLSGSEVIVAAPRLTADQAHSLEASHMRICTHSIDFEFLLDTADVCITHAGLALAGYSLIYGIPLMLFPKFAEQVLLAKRLQSLGLAVATMQIKNRYVCETKLMEILDEEQYRKNAKTFALAYEKFNPLSAIEHVLEEYKILTQVHKQ